MLFRCHCPTCRRKSYTEHFIVLFSVHSLHVCDDMHTVNSHVVRVVYLYICGHPVKGVLGAVLRLLDSRRIPCLSMGSSLSLVPRNNDSNSNDHNDDTSATFNNKYEDSDFHCCIDVTVHFVDAKRTQMSRSNLEVSSLLLSSSCLWLTGSLRVDCHMA